MIALLVDLSHSQSPLRNLFLVMHCVSLRLYASLTNTEPEAVRPRGLGPNQTSAVHHFRRTVEKATSYPRGLGGEK